MQHKSNSYVMLFGQLNLEACITQLTDGVTTGSVTGDETTSTVEAWQGAACGTVIGLYWDTATSLLE